MKSPITPSVYGSLLITTLLQGGSPHVSSTTDVSSNYPSGWCNTLGSPTRTTGECICKQDCFGPACQREQGLSFYSYTKCPTCSCVKRQVTGNGSNVHKTNNNNIRQTEEEEEENDIPDGIITRTKRKSASWKDREEEVGDEISSSTETMVGDDENTFEGTIIRTKQKKSPSNRFYASEDVNDTSEAIFVSYMVDTWRSVLGALSAVLFFTVVLPLLFLFGGMSNTKESGSNGNLNGSSERGRKDSIPSSNRQLSPRLPSVSPTSSGTKLNDNSGTTTTTTATSSSSSAAASEGPETTLHSTQKNNSLSPRTSLTKHQNSH